MASIKTEKKNAWSAFSKYIRLNYADRGGRVECYTCGKNMYWEKDGAQAGHVIDGRYNSILFEESGVRVQCYGCNCGKSGCKEEFIPKFIEEVGQEEFDRLKRLKNTQRDWEKGELGNIKRVYQSKVEQLKKAKGL